MGVASASARAVRTPTLPTAVLAQVWPAGPQPLLSGFFAACVLEPFDGPPARLAGALLSRAKSTDVVDASVVVGALRRGDLVLTSNTALLRRPLARTVGGDLEMIALCLDRWLPTAAESAKPRDWSGS